jgi:hypothetical protein
MLVLAVRLLSLALILILGSSIRAAAEPQARPLGSPQPVTVALVQQVAPQEPPSGDIEFKPALDLHQTPSAAEEQLRGGRIAVSKEWPASLYTTFQTPTGTAACTAALIGPEAMLTAAHCVPATGNVTFAYEGQTTTYKAQCARHPNYMNKSDLSADFALCKVAPAFTAPAGFQYETVYTSSQPAMLNDTIVLTGFGCISSTVADDATDDKYRIGTNVIDETSESPLKRRGIPYYSPNQRNNLFTADDPALANLCPGDSGGPAFRRTGGANLFTNRVIVGVNSRVFYTDSTKTSYGSSLVSSTSGPAFNGWAQDWAQSVAKVSACGLHGSVPNCRS